MSRSNLRDLKGGGVELQMKLSSLAEIERWVLSWGGDAKVIRPKELIDAVRRSARQILDVQAENFDGF